MEESAVVAVAVDVVVLDLVVVVVVVVLASLKVQPKACWQLFLSLAVVGSPPVTLPPMTGKNHSSQTQVRHLL